MQKDGEPEVTRHADATLMNNSAAQTTIVYVSVPFIFEHNPLE